MANPENKQIPYESTQKDIRDAIESVATAIGGIAIPSADHVSYDNTDSGLTADNVQDALDEIVENIPTVPSVDIQTAVDEFSTYNGGLLSSCKVALSPNQDLHGYSEPWVGGASKNKLPLTVDGIKSANSGATWTGNSAIIGNVTYTILTDSDGNVIGINANGLSNGSAFRLSTFNIASNSYILNGTPSTGSSTTYRQLVYNQTTHGYIAYDNGNGASFTLSDDSQISIMIVVANGIQITDQIFYPMIRLATESDPTFEPYSNICPISGHTQVEVDVSDGQTTQEQVTVNLGGTYYSGTLEVVSGVLTVDEVGVSMDGSESWNTHGAISHGFYCDNVIPSGLLMDSTKDDTAISNEYNQNRYDVATSMDNGKFAYGLTGGTVRRFILRDDRFSTVADLTTALGTTNLQLVMELATPTSIQLSPTMVKALVGENHLSAPLDGQEITESKYKQMFTFDDVIAYIQSLS